MKQHGNTGLKRSAEYKQKIRDTIARNGGRRGKMNPMWKGGVARESSKKWKARNMDRVLYLNLKRHASKFKNGGSHTFAEWQTLKAQYNFTCPCCGKSETEIKLTQDHIIPLSRGGSDNIENIQPLCRSCNCKKHTNITIYKSC